MDRVEERWKEIFQDRKAFWEHDGNVKRPHVELTTGRHSNQYFNSGLITGDKKLIREAAEELNRSSFFAGLNNEHVQVVVAPRKGGKELAEHLSQEIERDNHNECACIFARKSEKGKKRTMVFDKKDLSLIRGQGVLLCDDVFSTGSSFRLLERAVVRAGGIVLPYVLVLVNRSGKKALGDKEIISLVTYPIPSWTPARCPLCEEGSRALPAKANWKLLNQEY